MRRFRLLTQDGYLGLDKGYVYDAEFISREYSILKLAKEYPEDWQEVFDESKPLLKDTDLGYFAGLAMQSILHDPNWITEPKDAAKRSVEYAQALIEELRKEDSNG